MTKPRALLLGVPVYKDPQIDDLPFIGDDLKELKAVLEAVGYQVKVICENDSTDRDSIDQAIEKFLLGLDRDRNALIFLSGHGFHFDGADYFVPSTALKASPRFHLRCLKIDFRSYVEESLASNVIVCVDACREGLDLRGMSIGLGRWSTRKVSRVNKRQFVYVYACSAGQLAHYTKKLEKNFSIFSRAFAAVLRRADPPQTVNQLHAALQCQMNEFSQEYGLPRQTVHILSETSSATAELFESSFGLESPGRGRLDGRWPHKYRYISTAAAVAILIFVTTVALVQLRPASHNPDRLTIPVGMEPNGIAVTPDSGAIYVANYKSNTITKIDESTGSTATIQSYGGPNRLAITSDNQEVYVTDSEAGIVQAINTATNNQAKEIKVGKVDATPDDIVISADSSQVYVTNNNADSISIIDVVKNRVINVPVGIKPYDVVIGHATRNLYISNNQSNDVSVVDVITERKVANIPVGVAPYGLAVTPNGDEVFVANSHSSSVSVIDTGSNSVIATIPVHGNPIRVAISPNGEYAYAVLPDTGLIDVIDIARRSVKSIGVGETPEYIAITLDSGRAYVSNYQSASVSEITLSTSAVKTIPVGKLPVNLALRADGHRLYVANNADGTVTSLAAPFK